MLLSMHCCEKACVALDLRNEVLMCSVIASLIQVGEARIDGVYFEGTALELANALWDAIGQSRLKHVYIYSDYMADHQRLASAVVKMANLDRLSIG
jgi:hypothetical protein